MTLTDSLRARAVAAVFVVSLTILQSLSGVAHAEQRFVDPMFFDIEVQTDIQFGVGLRESSPDQALFLDVYAPRNDTNVRRPVVVLAFPGGFTTGRRDSAIMVQLANAFAQRGYVAASIIIG